MLRSQGKDGGLIPWKYPEKSRRTYRWAKAYYQTRSKESLRFSRYIRTLSPWSRA